MASRLGILEQRNWATWQLVAGVLVATVFGMAIGYSGNHSAPSAAATSTGIVALQKDGESGASSGASEATGSTSSSSTSTSSTTSTSLTASNAAPVELVANTTGQGPSSAIKFTAGGSWDLGWAYNCVGTAAGTGPFAVEAVAPSGPAKIVDTDGREGNAKVTSAIIGTIQLRVTTDAACRWALHIIGVPAA